MSKVSLKIKDKSQSTLRVLEGVSRSLLQSESKTEESLGPLREVSWNVNINKLWRIPRRETIEVKDEMEDSGCKDIMTYKVCHLNGPKKYEEHQRNYGSSLQ